MKEIRINMTIFFAFTIASFLNRCLNPFIYASQYEVVRRTWTPVVEFLRRRITGKPALASVRVEPLPTPTAGVSRSFMIASFLNRCLNPFIYASQYEVVRRTWTPVVEFLRRHVTRKPPAAATRVEPLPASSPRLPHPAGRELPMIMS